MQLSRRRFLALSATLTVTACASDGSSQPTPSDTLDSSPPDPTTAPTTPSSTSSTTTTAPTTTSTTTTTVATPEVELDEDPFAYGVASGDPDADSVVLWTRLAGALPDDGIDVAWTFTPDDGSEPISGEVRTTAAQGGSVHAVAMVPGPGTFRFDAGGWTSPEGRTQPIDPQTNALRIASASCQNYESGFYAAHGDIADWRPDLVVFLGDFIYESSSSELGEGVVRLHDPGEPTTLDGYRTRYATYLLDPQLQASRAAAPWLSIWDDHEVENNYAGLTPQDESESDGFAVRRAQAYQAWWENTPTRLPAPELADDPTAPYRIYRGIDVGDLVRISALDGRQFRDDQLSDATLDPGPPVEGAEDPNRSMLGTEQEAWAIDRFRTSSTIWNCLAQQTVFGDVTLPGTGAILNYDQWDGYAAARDRLLAAAPPNFVTLTGDIHLAGVGQLGPIDARLGVEFVTTGISSGQNVAPELTDLVTSIPAIVDAELTYRGYTRHTITPETWTAEYRQVVDIGDPDSEVRTWKSFRVDAGSPAVTEV